MFGLERASNFGGRRTIIEDGGRASRQAETALKIPLHGTFFGSRIKDDGLSTVSWAKQRSATIEWAQVGGLRAVGRVTDGDAGASLSRFGGCNLVLSSHESGFASGRRVKGARKV